MDVERLDDLRELIGEYWCLAFTEGQEGRNTDTPDGAAQKCISAIEAIIREARAALTPPEGYEETIRDAARYRWLCYGNGYFMEEESLCCGGNRNKEHADRKIDKAMAESEEVPDGRG